MTMLSPAHLFPDERCSLPVNSILIVVVDIELGEQDLIFVCSQRSLEGNTAQLQRLISSSANME